MSFRGQVATAAAIFICAGVAPALGQDEAADSGPLEPVPTEQGKTTGPTQSFGDAINSRNVIPGEVVVRFEPGSGAGGLLAEAQATVGTDADGTESLIIPRAKILQLPGDVGVREAVAELEALPGVAYAEPNFRRELLATPNDSFYPQTWGLHNTGQTIGGQPGIADNDIDAPEAWDYGTGDDEVIVGVIDSGVDLDHRDLQPNLWQNPGEVRNGVDDDGNGLVDDVNGWDFNENDSDPDDDTSGHGTHVAGTIAAQGNNGLDNVGVNWDAKIMALRIGVDLSRSVNSAAGAEAMYYAGREGARVVNGSYGGSGGSSQLELDAVRSAPQTLFVFAAGNSDNNNDQNPFRPAAMAETEPNVVSVAAIDNRGFRASFSNYGARSVNLGAPGVDIESTYISPSDLTVSEDPFGENPGTTAVYKHNFGFAFGGFDPGGWQTNLGSGWVISQAEGSDPNMFDSWAIMDSAIDHADPTKRRTNYLNNEDSYAQSNDGTSGATINFGGLENCSFRFWTKLNLADAGDRVVYQVSRDAGATFPFEVGATGPFTFEDQLIFALGSQFDRATNGLVRVQLNTNGAGTASGVVFDTPSIVCASAEVTPTHGQISGTSMASPAVAGAASLLAAHAPDASGADLEARLLGTVEPSTKIAPLVSTGGTLNLERLTRPPTATITSGPTVGGDIVSVGFELEALNAAVGATAECSLDGGAYAPCDSSTDETYVDLAKGEHTFSVRGNWKGYASTPATTAFTVEGGGGNGSQACEDAKKKFKKAKKKLKKAKQALKEAKGKKAIEEAEAKVAKLTRKLRKLKAKMKAACA